MYKLCKKLGKVKKDLKKLHRTSYARIHEKREEYGARLDKIQEELMKSPTDSILQAMEKEMTEKYTRTVESSNSLLRQQVKMEWIKDGDECKSFFQQAKAEKEEDLYQHN